ncbi:hypothetical protein HLB44_33405 [Aquincola sp. S2]|uniref:Tetratricopeptide repeat protein n=1 Tax=Pseudaquabacterium terrae TaxID=2732868 RepID=A0ABX2ET22_9BURK|nr:hypothetical protein [Aquabacterium terrae]NRF71895.1 hypothetical protein [Aquabacterium terrae]
MKSDRSLAALKDRAERGLPEGFARQALTLAMRALDAAELRGRPADVSNALAQVARCLKALGAFGAAEDYLMQSLRWTVLVPGTDARVDLVCELSEVTCAIAEAAQAAGEDDPQVMRNALERARDHAFEAASLAGQTSDAQWEVKVLLRISDVLERCGDHDDAATMQNRAISLMGLNGDLARAARDAGGELPLAPGSTLLM